MRRWLHKRRYLSRRVIDKEILKRNHQMRLEKLQKIRGQGNEDNVQSFYSEEAS